MAKLRVIKRISITEVEKIAFVLAQQHLTFDEPIPDFSTRFPNILESCISTPFQKFYGKTPYPSFVAKASMLFYLLIKDHPFQNGNKRIAITTLLVFLLKNDKWLEVDKRLLYEFTVWVASGRPEEKNFVLMAINEFLKTNIISY